MFTLSCSTPEQVYLKKKTPEKQSPNQTSWPHLFRPYQWYSHLNIDWIHCSLQLNTKGNPALFFLKLLMSCNSSIHPAFLEALPSWTPADVSRLCLVLILSELEAFKRFSWQFLQGKTCRRQFGGCLVLTNIQTFWVGLVLIYSAYCLKEKLSETFPKTVGFEVCLLTEGLTKPVKTA